MDIDEAKIPSILSTKRMKPAQSWYMKKTYRQKRAVHIHSYGKSSNMGEERSKKDYNKCRGADVSLLPVLLSIQSRDTDRDDHIMSMSIPRVELCSCCCKVLKHGPSFPECNNCETLLSYRHV